MDTQKIGLKVALALAAQLSASAGAQVDGDFDTSYGSGDGVRLIQPSISTISLEVRDLAIGPDGRSWMVGSGLIGGNWEMFACHTNPTGTGHSCLTFGFDLGEPFHDIARAVATQPISGAVVVAGSTSGPSGDAENRIAVVRLTSAGVLDPSFGGGTGKVHLALPGAVEVVDVKVLPDGRIVFAATITQTPFGFENKNFLVGRLLADGAWDESFDGDGRRVVLFDVDGNLEDKAAALALGPDGSVFVLGTATTSSVNSTSLAVAKLDADGVPDPTFDGDGELTFSPGGFGVGIPEDILVDYSGRILLSARVVTNDGLDLVGMARLHADGLFDGDFGSGGKRLFGVLAMETLTSLAGPVLLAGPSGAIGVVAAYETGSGANPSDTSLFILDGAGDTQDIFTYAAIPSVAASEIMVAGLAEQGGKLLVAGQGQGTTAGHVARIWRSSVFADDFETGNTNRWSVAVGSGGGPS